MINFITLKNFKTFSVLDMTPKRLNLFVGLNGMGKSTIIQSLLLLRQSRSDRTLVKGYLKLNGELVNIGTSRDALYQYAIDSDISKANEISFSFSFTTGTINDIYLHEPEEEILEPQKEIGVESFLDTESLFNRNFQYINADRKPPSTNHTKGYFRLKNSEYIVGVHGEYAVHLLYAAGNEIVVHEGLRHPKSLTPSLTHQVEAWLGEISPGVKLHILPSNNNQEFQLFFKFSSSKDYSNDYRPENVGFGLSYVLPIIVALLVTPADGLIIIENPEAHLHPRGQAELGKLIALSANVGRQIFIETHSDHIINGVRVAVREKLIPNEEVLITFLDRPENSEHSNAIYIRIDAKGELSEYPERFLDEWSNQLFKLL